MGAAAFAVYPPVQKGVTHQFLLTSGKLPAYLADVEKQAKELFECIVKQMAEREGIIGKLKADNQMEWVGRMNAIREAAMATVNTEVIFV